MYQTTKYYLHGLELVACYRELRKRDPIGTNAENALFRSIAAENSFYIWKEDIMKYLKQPRSVKTFRKELLMYYVAADASIYRTMKSLKVSQQKVYEMREKLPTLHKSSPIEGFFVDHPEVIGNIDALLKDLKLMDGFYLTDR